MEEGRGRTSRGRVALRSRKSRGRSLPPSRGARGAAAASIVTPSHGPDFRGGKVAVCVWCRPAAAAAGQECAQVPDRPSAPLPSVRGRARQLRVPVGQRVAGWLCTAVQPRRHRVGPLHVTGVSGPNAHACPPGTTGRPKRVSPSGPGRGWGPALVTLRLPGRVRQAGRAGRDQARASSVCRAPETCAESRAAAESPGVGRRPRDARQALRRRARLHGS